MILNSSVSSVINTTCSSRKTPPTSRNQLSINEQLCGGKSCCCGSRRHFIEGAATALFPLVYSSTPSSASSPSDSMVCLYPFCYNTFTLYLASHYASDSDVPQWLQSRSISISHILFINFVDHEINYRFWNIEVGDSLCVCVYIYICRPCWTGFIRQDPIGMRSFMLRLWIQAWSLMRLRLVSF